MGSATRYYNRKQQIAVYYVLRVMYQISAGMDISFAQYVASVTLSENGAHTANVAGSSSSSSSSSSKSKSHQARAATAVSSEGFDGELHLLTDITRKLLVVPTHPIGKKRDVQVVEEQVSSIPNKAGAKAKSMSHIPQPLQQSWMPEMALFHQETAVPSNISSSASGSGVGAAANGGTKKAAAPKPNIRIRMSGQEKDKEKKSNVPPSAVRFTLSSTTQLNRGSGATGVSGRAGDKDKSNGSKTHDEVTNEAMEGANAADYYADEFVGHEGGEDDMDADM
jgi:hypothetical protein